MKILVLALLALTFNVHALDFKKEGNATTRLLDCRSPKISAASGGSGRLYGCIAGRAETVKLFINEGDGSNGKVKNIKFMWNDWSKDLGIGYPVHADQGLAHKWLKKIADKYAPKKSVEVFTTFLRDKNRTIKAGKYLIKYRFTRGPAIDERLLTITTIKHKAKKNAVIKAAKTDFEQCKVKVAKAVGYSKSRLSGDGESVIEKGYKSFLITSNNKDMFFCGVHPRNKYKIKAALGGKFPFKYIAEGKFR